jgi:hypothetical protein
LPIRLTLIIASIVLMIKDRNICSGHVQSGLKKGTGSGERTGRVVARSRILPVNDSHHKLGPVKQLLRGVLNTLSDVLRISCQFVVL